jgi:hypothetical protein
MGGGIRGASARVSDVSVSDARRRGQWLGVRHRLSVIMALAAGLDAFNNE